jgi:hypothetical protein
MLAGTVFTALGRGRGIWLIIVIDIVYMLVLGFQLYWNDCLPWRPKPQENELEQNNK